MPVVVLDVVAMVLHGVEDFGSRSSTVISRYGPSPDALIVEGQIGDPTTVIPYPLSVFQPVLEKLTDGLVLVAVQGRRHAHS